MIKYDEQYFYQVLLRLKSVNFERYQHISEKDLLIQALNGEEITDHSEIDWVWLKDDLFNSGNTINPIVYFNLDDKLEHFIYQIVPREERVRILTYLRDNCRECLFYEYNYDEECIRAFETECARLISQEIEGRKRDQFHGDYLDWPIPNLKEIALPAPKKSKYSLIETAILKAIPNYSENNPPVTKDILLRVAYEFIDYFRASVKTYNENGRDNRYKPCMSHKEQADKIYNLLIRRANRYLYWNRTPVYQVYFILGCLMGMPDHRRSWHEEKFAEGIGDYLEMTDHFKGSKEKIKNVIQGLLAMSQYQLDFDMENVEKAMSEQTEQLRQEQEKLESERLPKPKEPKPEPKVEQKAEEVNPDSSFFSITEKMTHEMCKNELLRILTGARSKATACKEILTSALAGYFVLSDKTNQEKADLINPWVKLTVKDYVFTAEDFRKASCPKKTNRKR